MKKPSHPFKDERDSRGATLIPCSFAGHFSRTGLTDTPRHGHGAHAVVNYQVSRSPTQLPSPFTIPVRIAFPANEATLCTSG
jgi:hypothetical protein